MGEKWGSRQDSHSAYYITYLHKAIGDRTNQNLWFSTFSSSYHSGSFCGVANLSRYSEERKFCQVYQHFRLPERGTYKICFAQLYLSLPSSPLIRHILFSYCVYTRTMEAKRATLENTSCKRTSSGRAIWSPTLQASAIWPDIKGEQSSNS